jgi:hypothetical protein
MPARFLRCAFVLAAAAVCSWHIPAAHAQQRNQRIILKDGSYQAVTQYEVQGDRVHYMSAERFEWEDIPAALVDWDATSKYNKELSTGKLTIRAVETPEEKEAREKEEANSPEIAPGLRLPGTGGVFLYDQFQNKPELAEIVQNGSEVEKTSRKKNVLRSAINPLAASKQGFSIRGEHAPVQSHLPRPTIYIDIDEGPQADATLGDRFRIVRATPKNGTRIIGDVKVTVTGKVSEETSSLPTKLEKLGTGQWLKLTPAQDLTPGEYALVEMLSPQEMNLYVWDFGVNPKAPANPNTSQPAK